MADSCTAMIPRQMGKRNCQPPGKLFTSNQHCPPWRRFAESFVRLPKKRRCRQIRRHFFLRGAQFFSLLKTFFKAKILLAFFDIYLIYRENSISRKRSILLAVLVSYDVYTFALLKKPKKLYKKKGFCLKVAEAGRALHTSVHSMNFHTSGRSTSIQVVAPLPYKWSLHFHTSGMHRKQDPLGRKCVLVEWTFEVCCPESHTGIDCVLEKWIILFCFLKSKRVSLRKGNEFSQLFGLTWCVGWNEF